MRVPLATPPHSELITSQSLASIPEALPFENSFETFVSEFVQKVNHGVINGKYCPPPSNNSIERALPGL